MRLIPITEATSETISVLQAGGVIVCPTDTIYGLSCLASKQEAVAKIQRFKGSPLNKPLILLASSLEMVEQYSQLSDLQREMATSLWQEDRPTSIILPQKPGNLLSFLSQNNALSWRLPKSQFLLKIIETLGVPLVSTSFNKSGLPPYEEVASLLDKDLGAEAPDLIIDNGTLKSQPSRLLDLSGQKLITIRP